MSMTGVYDVDQRQDDRSEHTIRRALDSGITLLDTADSYGPFTNELLIGRAIAGNSNAVISTKVGVTGRSDGAVLRNAHPDHIATACDASLRRLQVDRIDLYNLHAVDPHVPIAESWAAMSQLVQAGKVRALGVMTDDVQVVNQLQQVFPVTAVMTQFSLWSQSSRGLINWCGDRGIGVLAKSPLGRGFLTGTITPTRKFAWTDLRSKLKEFNADALAADRPIIDLLKAVGRRHKAAPGQVALAWLLAQGNHVIALTGTKRPDHLEENARASDLQLTELDLRQLNGDDVDDELTALGYSVLGYSPNLSINSSRTRPASA